MTNFISEDKMTINLPVPIGSIVYVVSTNCGDFCMFQKEKFDAIFPKKAYKPNIDRCGWDKLCQTRMGNILEKEVTIKNLDFILDNWNVNCFKTREEAENVARARVAMNVETMSKLGFAMREDGYSTTDQVEV